MAFLRYLGEIFCAAMPPALLLVGLFFMLRLRAFPFLRPGRVLRGLFAGRGGGSLRAMLMALGGTVGVGNIAGVALALLTGGPGAIFWMWVCAFFAMILKYAEITLAMDSRTPDGRGSYTGGTAHAMRAVGWRAAATLFAALCLGYTLLVGGAVQANAIAECLADSFALSPWLVGLVLIAISLPVAVGGGKRIAALSARLVPLMCVFYLLTALVVITRNAANLPAAFRAIITGAFTPAAGAGGALGFLFSRAARIGAARGLMSNEGGCGTAPMAHITAEETTPARQGLFGILEVFIDTTVICTLTALMLLCAFPTLPAGLGGMALVRGAIGTVFGGAAGPLLSLALFAFAYATVLCNLFYGQVCLSYFTASPRARWGFLSLFGGALFFGATADVGAVWGLTDLLLAAMTYLNLAFLLARAGRVVSLSVEGGLIEKRKRPTLVGRLGALQKRGKQHIQGGAAHNADQSVAPPKVQ